MGPEENEPLIEMLFRNGTLTVVGILLSFSLTFVTHWSDNPIPWTLVDLPTLLLLIAGIIGQSCALIILLRHDSLRKRVYDRANKWFIAGMGLTAIGVVSAIVVDFFEIIAAG